ncbi:hypothetical protein HY988_00850 [Candidatus Micrarchaeota archaeon]|nr:hypothetical protein [Candidatus Micrarchaeota archaeon]
MSGVLQRSNIVFRTYSTARILTRAALFSTALMAGTLCGCQKYEDFGTRIVGQRSEFVVIQMKQDSRIFLHAGIVDKVDDKGIEVLTRGETERKRYSYGTHQISDGMRIKVERGSEPGTAKVTVYMVEHE